MKSQDKPLKLEVASGVFVRSNTKLLAETAVAIALGTVLSFVKFTIWPQGGSVTAGSMVPLLWLGLRRGAKLGIVAGIVYGIIQLIVEPYVYHPVQVLLDYPLAFGALGLAGLFRNRGAVGVTVAIIGRFLAHFVSGIVFFATYAPQIYLGLNIGADPYLYSALYNGTYLLPELVISLLITVILIKRNIIDLYR